MAREARALAGVTKAPVDVEPGGDSETVYWDTGAGKVGEGR